LAPDVSEDGVAVALWNESYVTVISTCRKGEAGNALRASAAIEFREADSARWVQSDAVKDYDNESRYYSPLVSTYDTTKGQRIHI
jgi:hypothetical protein